MKYLLTLCFLLVSCVDKTPLTQQEKEALYLMKVMNMPVGPPMTAEDVKRDLD